MRNTGRILLDAEDTGPLADRVRRLIEDDTTHRVADLHVWRVGIGAYACIVTVLTSHGVCADELKARRAQLAEIKHVTVEVNWRE